MNDPKTIELKADETSDTVGADKQSSEAADCCEKIREAAYYKWEAAGYPCGDGVEFWLAAEAELNSQAPRND